MNQLHCKVTKKIVFYYYSLIIIQKKGKQSLTPYPLSNGRGE